MIPLTVKYDSRTLHISIHREPFAIPVQDILFIEVFNWKCIIHQTSGATISVNVPLKQLAEQLLSPSFVRCGRSFLVNLTHLVEVTPDTLYLRGGSTIPIPRRGRAELVPYCTRFLTEEHS